MKKSIDFMENIGAAMKGFEIANRIVEDDSTVHYLIMNRPLGDAFRMLRTVALLKVFYSGKEPYYKEDKYGNLFPKKRIIKKIVVVANAAQASLAKIFNSVDGIIALSQEELRNLNIYAKSYICVHENLHRDEYGSDIDTTEDLVKQKLFKVPSYNWVMDLPPDIPGRGALMLSSIEIPKSSLLRANEIFLERKTLPENAIILCPYARSSLLVSANVWERIIKKYQDLGFVIYTNIGDAKEECALPNTIALKESPDVVLAMGKLGCIVIAIQSGLADAFRWLEMDIKLVSISVLATEFDEVVARNRRLTEQVEMRENTAHILYRNGEEALLLREVDEKIQSLMRGNTQYQRYSEVRQGATDASIAVQLRRTNSINEYLDVLLDDNNDYMLFLSVSDSANKYWAKFPTKKLGITSDLSDVWRRSFLAVYDTRKGLVYEEMAPNNGKLVYHSSFSKNQYYITSRAMGKGKYTKSAIVINGQNYSLNGRGLNLVVFDLKRNTVVDSVYVDLWADETLSINRI